MSLNKPLVSIILVTYNSEKYLNDCLKSISNISYIPLEVVVVDNNSKDDSLEIVNEHKKKMGNMTIIENAYNEGYAKAVNIAARKASGEFIFILNPDTIVTKDFIQPLIKTYYNNNKAAVVQPAVFLVNDNKKLNLTGKTTHYLGFDWVSNLYNTDVPDEQEITSFSGSAVLIDRKIFLDVGGYDEDYFMYYEDSDLSWRLRLSGYKIYFTPESKIDHDYKYEPDEKYQRMKDKLYFNERNRIVTVIKNYKIKTLFIIFIPFIVTEVMMNIYAVSKGWWVEKVSGYLWIIKNKDKIIRKRSEAQHNRRISDSEITEKYETRLTFQFYNIAPVKYILNPLLDLYWSLVKGII